MFTARPAARPRGRIAVLVSGVLVVAPFAVALAATAASAAETRATAVVSASRVTPGRQVLLSGTIDAAVPGATVTLQRQVPGGWQDATAAAPVTDGSYSVSVPTGWYGRFQYRAVVQAPSWSEPVVSEAQRLTVLPDYHPRGNPRDYALSAANGAARWDPCDSIRYQVNLGRATPGSFEDLRKALLLISEASGLQFDYAGQTTQIPQGTMDESYPDGVDLVIAWAKPSESEVMKRMRGAAGVGGIAYTSGYQNADGSPAGRIARGMVVVDADQATHYRGGFGKWQTRGELLMHEIGHAVGLQHARTRSQILYPMMQNTKAEFGAGDLAGLAAIGANQGCLTEEDSGWDPQSAGRRGTVVPPTRVYALR